MTITELKAVKRSLDGLAKTPTSLALVIARNLSKVNAEIKRADDDYNEAQKMLFEKDGEGNLISYLADEKGNIFKEADGTEVLYDQKKYGPPKQGENIVFKFTDPEAAAKIRNEYFSEEHDIQLNIFNASVLELAIASGAISAELLLPLLGNIIPETE